MSKLKQSISVLRQIPEHIRTNYPAFVEFIQIYYQYLEQTQQQNFEGLHDIDTTTEEFIDKFKGELSKNFPVHLASDKRLVLKHLREFYLSRGSEASYKFLFRTLFGKEASLYYPSRQMLRVSDGRWTQDVSIFVKEIGEPLTDPSIAIGNFTYITNKRGKVIRAVVKNISKYSEGIYEVSISRDNINEIDVGSISQDETGRYKAIVLPCPTSVKIYKGGKGFAAGDIFALKTQIGRGCTIKVTEVDSEGSIKKIQVMRFGLDYETKFYSYLSSKDDIAFEYIHPLKIGAGAADTKTYTATSAGTKTYSVNYLIESGNPLLVVEVFRNNALVTPTPSYTATNGTSVTINNLQTGDVVQLYGITAKGVAPPIAYPAYNEKSGGFVDYGWASKQTYFYYDQDIPIGDVSRASDRYFADSSYVGEIVQQFYNEATTKVVDEDLAIIEVELGAVAKYPGYYSTADGFISDEIYIQDGNYYQAFSYVIRVEEELRRYADIIKALVHPSGMKLFSEYEIFNQLELEYTQPRSLLSITLPLYDHPPSNTITDDRGVGYTKYDTFIEGDIIEVTPSIDASPVYANQGKLAYNFIKRLADIVASPTSSNNKVILKNISDAITERFTELILNDGAYVERRNYDETYLKHVQKPFDDTVAQPQSVIVKNPLKYVDDTSSTISAISSKSDEKPIAESQALSDNQIKLVEKPIAESQALSDNQIKLVEKSIAETQALSDGQVKATDKPLTENQAVDDAPSKEPQKPVNETLSTSDDYSKYVEKPVAENQVIDDAHSKKPQKLVSEAQSSDDAQAKDSEKNHQENQAVDDAPSKEPQKPVNDTQSLADAQYKHFYKNLLELQEQLDTLAKFAEKSIQDTQEQLDLPSKEPNKLFGDLQSQLDEVVQSIGKEFSDSQSQADSIVRAFSTSYQDTQSALDNTARDMSRPLSDSFLIDDLLSKNPNKIVDDIVSSPTDDKNIVSEKNISDSSSTGDSYNVLLERIIEEVSEALDALGNHVKSNISDTLSLSDEITVARAKLIDDILDVILDSISQILDKLVEDNIITSDALLGFALDRSITESINLPESYAASLNKSLTPETITTGDVYSNNPEKRFVDSSTLSDTYFNTPEKNVTETLSLSETYVNATNKSVIDDQALSDSNIKEYGMNPVESISLGETIDSKTDKPIADNQSIADIYSAKPDKPLEENQSVSDSYVKSYNKNLAESISIDEVTAYKTDKSIDDVQLLSEIYSNNPEKVFADSQSLSDSSVKLYDTGLVETINTTMSGKMWLNPYDAEGYFAEDYIPFIAIN